MECAAAREILDGAFDGGDLGADLAQAEAHADLCSACAAYRRELRAYAAIMGDLPEVEVPEGLEARLLVAVERTKPRRRSPLLPITFVTFVAFGAILGAQIVQKDAEDRARQARETQAQHETINRSIARDRATFAADPIGGTPVVAFSGYAGR